MKKSILAMMMILSLNTISFAGGNEKTIEPLSPVAEIPQKEGSFYVGVGQSNMKLNNYVTAILGEFDYSWDDAVKQNANVFITGYNFHQYIGIEARYVMGKGDASRIAREVDTQNEPLTYNYNIDFKNIAIYLKPMFSFENFTLYGLLGYGKTSYIWDPNFETFKNIQIQGLQYGIGLNLKIINNLSIFADYTTLQKINDKNHLGDSQDYGGADFYQMHSSGQITTVGVIYTF